MLVDFADLQRISRLKSKAAICRYLDKLRIKYRTGSDGAPWTTTEALNQVLLHVGGSRANLDACGPRPRGGRRSRGS